MTVHPKFAAHAAAIVAAVSPAFLVNAETLHRQCEDSVVAACRGLGRHPLHTIEDGPHYLVSTATHTATGAGA